MNQQQFENGEQQMAPQTSGSDAVPSQPLPPKKGNQKVIWLIVLIAVLIIGACTAGYFYYQRNNETMAYNVLTDNEKVEDYEDFLRRFPDSPHADEVRDRLAKLRTMYDEWARLANSAYVSDFERFKSNYPTSSLAKQCDLKIDSLDWQEALKTNTPEAIAAYIARHPDGRYLSEASQAQNNIVNTQVDETERENIASTLSMFYDAFGENDEAGITTCITPIMSRFLSKTNVTKADVVNVVAATYNEHILNCTFTLNNDYVCTKTSNEQGEKTYNVKFTVDQRITRDNHGKTFGSYTATATLNGQFKISALTMNEVSRRESDSNINED